MAPQRRIRTTIILSITALIALFYIYTGASSTRSSEFYTRTVAILDQKTAAAAAAAADADAVAQKSGSDRPIDSHFEGTDLGPGPGVRDSKNGQAPIRPPAGIAVPKKDAVSGHDVEDVEVDRSMDGPPRVHRKKRPSGDDDELRHGGEGAATRDQPVKGAGAGAGMTNKKVEIPDDASGRADAARAADGVAKVGNTGRRLSGPQKALSEDVEDDRPDTGKLSEGQTAAQGDRVDPVEVELDRILKRAPIIIFSKTYCRFSKNAKRLLLNKYKIVPTPFVVELDEHKMGPEIQAALFKISGRKTVPNILVNGKSIGGSDDLDALEAQGTLKDELIALGGKRLIEVSRA